MNADELQRWASVLRWVGLSITVIGALITFGSHYLADKLLVVQRADKAAAQERLKASDAELQATKAKTAELENRLAPRQFSLEQRRDFVAALADSPKGPITVVYVSPQPESIAFVGQIRSLMADAGFTLPNQSEYALHYTITSPAPWFVAIIAHPHGAPPYTLPVQQAFKRIGIDASLADGSQIAKPGELKIHVGGK